MTQQAPQQISNKPRPTCRHCKNQVTIKTNAVNSNERKTKREIVQIVPTVIIMEVPKQTLTPTTTKLIPKEAIQIIKETEDQDLCFYPVRHVVGLTTPQRNSNLEQTQRTDRLHETEDRRDKTRVSRIMLKTTQIKTFKLPPKL